MSPDHRDGELPPAVDDAMHEVFARASGEQETVFADLLAAHPEHAHALLLRWRAVVAADAGDGGAAPTGIARYRIDGTLGRGGMGEVLRAHDLLLDRPVALKVARVGGGDEALARCRTEARITALLEHSGIAPVHDLGTDGDGGAWFVMRRIDGASADALFAAAAGDPRRQARALEVLHRVAETLAFAHARGVVHRDLKPANVMVGSFGEVYVVDWGLAKKAGSVVDAGVGEAARDGSGAEPADPGVTRAGLVIGTPSYMPPERARGGPLPADPRTDVYALGAMLYQVLAGEAPFAPHGNAEAVLAALRAGPPPPLARVARRAPQALIAVCERAMARAPEGRYADAGELAADLAAFRSARAVKAYRTGPVAELVLWVRRNRALAGALAVLCVGALVALIVVTLAFRDADQSRRRFRGLASVVQLEEARRRAAELFPPWPEQLPALQVWNAMYAEPLRAEHQALAAELARLRARATPPTPAEPGPRFADVDDGILFASLSRHAAELDAFFAAGGLAAQMREREQWAAAIGPRSIDEQLTAWRSASAAVAADPRFGGFALAPQVGLVPLGGDRESGLQEFAELRTGPAPRRDEAGNLRYDDDSGVVFVLLPGGRTWIGAQAADPQAPNHWPGAKPDEAPVQEVRLAPFFLAKHELTQAQWQRLAGYNPSLAIGTDTARHPVGHVSWVEAERVLRENGMVLPTEAQWEYACRAGAGTAWATGDTVASLQGFANVADASARDAYGPGFRFEPGLVDGFVADAPVGSFAANAFGLHDLLGNHWEWCLDAYESPRRLAEPGSRVDRGGGAIHRVYRGGSYAMAADNFARCAYRGKAPGDTTLHDLGLRTARLVR